MKTIYLIRHAKSSWSNGQLSDFDRPLNERGKRDRVTMANRLKAREEKPEIWISSSAKRTRQTTKKMCSILGFDFSEVVFFDELYHASHFDILNCINQLENENQILFLTGHNPGISVFCDCLCNYSVDFTTCGIAKIEFESAKEWAEISGGTGNLIYFDYPKKE